jgi:hypothetical protein
MNNLYRLTWYDEDGYGIIRHTTIVIYSESEAAAIENSKKYLTETVFEKPVEETERFLSDYPKFKIELIKPNSGVIWCDIDSCI